MKKSLSILLSIVMIFTLSGTAWATGNNQSSTLKQGSAPVLQQASQLLNSSPTTQTIVRSEKEMIEEMLKDNTISREELNQELSILSSEPTAILENKGYNDNQISIIKSYTEGEDAFNHVFNSNSRSARSDATLTFRYGLVGSNTKKSVQIAYDMQWSSCPFFTFTDSFGVGWIAADSNSYEIVTKTDDAMAQVYYYNPSTNQSANLYRDVELDTSSNGVIIGVPIIGSADGNYGKLIGGVANISTQSNSYNMETIHLFVSYGHTLVAISSAWDAALGWNKLSGAITFSPKFDQDILAQDDHTFKYNDQGSITAD